MRSSLYRVSQEGRSVFWEVIISVILNKLTRIAKCIDVDSGIFKNVLN
jgi:hypothetical protein